MSEPIAEAFVRIVELAEALGVQRINELPACWEHQVDEQWRIHINAHRHQVKAESGAEVPPRSCYIEFNGWPAGVITPVNGWIAAGEAANERTFIEALKRAKDEVRHA